jgi:hypothetical protein
LYLFRWFSYFLEKQETIYCFSIFNRSRIVLWHILPKRLFSYVGYMQLWERLFSYAGYMQLWESLFLILLLYIVTTRVLFKLLTTRFFMNKLSTLRLTVILLVIISNMHRYFAFCFFFFTDCRFLYQVVFYFSFSFLVGKPLMLVAVTSWVWGEMLRNIVYFVLFIKDIIIFLF